MRKSPYDYARKMGRRAFLRGTSERRNPYNRDAQAFRSAWLDGYRQAKKEAARGIQAV